MPFIKEDLDDVHESTPVPEGEYDLQILKAEEKKSKKEQVPMAALIIKIDDKEYPTASPVRHWLLSPEKCEPDIAHLRKLEFKRFCECFGLDYDCEIEDMVGATGNCMLIQEESEEDGNIYNRLRLPRLKE